MMRARTSIMLAAGAAIGLIAAPASAQSIWPAFAGGPDRLSTAPAAPSALTTARWTLSADAAGTPITFIPQAGVVSSGSRVYAIGRLGGSSPSWRIFAIDAETGSIVYTSAIAAPVAESWSSPAIDPDSGLLVIASGNLVQAFDLATGIARWTRPLPRSIVNASPLITTDRGPADRLLITDFDGFGSSAQLHCINIDPFDASTNPFQPSQIVWSRPIAGSSGNTPAYLNGVVYVGSSGNGSSDIGRVLAFPITGDSATPPTWTFVNSAENGFFGGVCIADTSTGPAVFAASYGFFGGLRSSQLIKVDAATGALMWSAPSNRTSATPVPLSGGFIAVSGGILGFGTVPSVQLFRDLGTSYTSLYDTAEATWADANNNGLMDPGEYLAVGGWTHQPIAVPLGTSSALPPARLVVGSLSASTSAPNPELLMLDLTKLPSDPGFILQRTSTAGGTPAIADVWGKPAIFSVGSAGLTAIGGGCSANCDGSTTAPVLGAADFSCFLARYRAGDAYANCDNSTTTPVLGAADFSCFLARYRRGCP